MGEPQLTERQRKWMASVREGLERDTGRSLAQWVEIAHSCPATRPRERLRWFKDTHGLLQNRASYVLSEAFPSDKPSWSDPDKLAEILWADPASRAIFDAVAQAAKALPDTLSSQRKSYTAFSRKVQYAAARPGKGGIVMLGLAVAPDSAPGLEPSRNESWSERLKSRLALKSPADVDERISSLLRRAWEAS